MLRELSVQNLALLEDARVELQPGYCVWTGETGAGKSLLLTALSLVLGGKASTDLVRADKPEARAAAVFEITDSGLRADLEAILGGPIEGDDLILMRRISTSGKSSASVNGLPVTAGTLREVGARLIDIHGQHEGRALLEPERQRALLDAHGGLERLLAFYREKRQRHDGLRKRRIALEEAAARRTRERDLLVFERDELAAAEPRVGEHDELTHEAHRLANVEQVRGATAEGYHALYEADHSAQEILESIARKLGPLAESVPELSDAAADLGRLAEEVRDVAYSLRKLGETWQDDPERLEEIETRLALYRRLSSRFRCAPDDLAARRADVEAQLAALERDDADLAGLDGPLSESWVELKAAASALTIARRKAGKGFSRAVQAHMKSLCLPEATIGVEVEPILLGDDPMAGTPPEDGADRVEFVFRPNPGEVPRPLRKIASGGELSRVTLAAKTVLADVDRVPTLVFDEIDTGVGGRLGAALGKALAELAKTRQVLCVTHLPQMASFARHQWVIRKQVARGRTRTTISQLTEPDRVIELAAMLRGDSAAESTRAEALAMLAEAKAVS
ncbi:MAG: recN [Planctomycetota bacterium]|nr:recN [Planctomycetota bacterium]